MIACSSQLFLSSPSLPKWPSSNASSSGYTLVVEKSSRLRSAQPPSASARRCRVYDLHRHLIPYAEALAWQKSVVNKQQLLMTQRGEDNTDLLIVLQHPPTYTLGTGSSNEFLKFDSQDAPFDLYRTDRGGEVTYHGPGQLVAYPILNLRHHKMDLHWYLRSLEQVVIELLRSAFHIEASRLDGFTGVWVGDKKIAAIGIHVSKWITYHGLALNVAADLTPFEHIIPCGIRDRGVGSVKELLGQTFTRSETEDGTLLDTACEALINNFMDVFQLVPELAAAHELPI